MSFIQSIGYSLTDILIFIMAVFILLLGIVTGNSRRRVYYLFTFFFLVVAIILEFVLSHRSVHALYYNMFAGDGFSYLLKIVVLITAFIYLGTWGSEKPYPSYRFQFLFLINVLSVSLLGGSMDVISLIISLEMFNLSLLLLVSDKGEGEKNFADARKLYLSRFFSSGIIIMGLMGLVICSGATRWDLIGSHIIPGNTDIYIQISLILIVAGFGFHLSVFPFHYINLDASTHCKRGKGIYFIVISQLAGIAVLIRIMSSIFLSADINGSGILTDNISGLLASFGIVTALLLPLQLIKNPEAEKRILFFSASYSGIILIALSCLNLNSVRAIILLLLGMMPTIILIDYLFHIKYHGISYSRRKFFNIVRLVMLASFIGLPPLGTFFGKIQIMSVLHEKRFFLPEAVIIIHSAFLLFLLFDSLKREDYEIIEKVDSSNSLNHASFIPIVISISAVILLLFMGIFWNFISRGIYNSLSFVFFNF